MYQRSVKVCSCNHVIALQGYKWKAKSRLPSIANSTNEFALFSPGKGMDADPCSTWYPGHRPFEAPEVNNIANYIQTLPDLKAFIDLRSYGQMRTLAPSNSVSAIAESPA